MNSFLPRTRIGRTLAVASFGLMMAGGISPAGATPITWSDGVFVDAGSAVNCLGQTVVRMQGYVGYGRRPGNQAPAVGEVYYAHIVVAHPAQDCANGGSSATAIGFAPPPNTQLAVSGGDPIFCFWRRHDSFDAGFNSHGTLFNMACTQNPSVDGNGYYNLAPTTQSFWPFPQYSWMEFLIPLRSTAPVNFQNAFGRLNPDLDFDGFPSVAVQVTNNAIFRDGFDGMTLFLDLCTLPFTTGC